MKLNAGPIRGDLAAALAAALLAGAAASLVAWSQVEHSAAQREWRAARSELARTAEGIERTAREAASARELAAAHGEFVSRGIVGGERRLDWGEALARSRDERRIAELRYQIEPRRSLQDAGAAPGGVKSFASTLKFQAAVLHEGELLGLLADLRASGGAWHAARRCAIQRIAQAAPGPAAPRLTAECDIDLITIEVAGTEQ